MKKPRIKEYSTRVIKKFAWFPITTLTHKIWWEYYYQPQVFHYSAPPFGFDRWIKYGKARIRENPIPEDVQPSNDKKAQAEIRKLLKLRNR